MAQFGALDPLAVGISIFFTAPKDISRFIDVDRDTGLRSLCNSCHRLFCSTSVTTQQLSTAIKLLFYTNAGFDLQGGLHASNPNMQLYPVNSPFDNMAATIAVDLMNGFIPPNCDKGQLMERFGQISRNVLLNGVDFHFLHVLIDEYICRPDSQNSQTSGSV